MEQAAKEILLKRCQQAGEHHERVRHLLPNGVPKRSRLYLSRSAIDLAVEHHLAIVALVEAGRYSASAAALLRPLLESGASAWWFLYVAPTDRLRRIRTAIDDPKLRDKVPELSDCLKGLEKLFPGAAVLRRGLNNEGSATWLHDFTHGGVLQLRRRSQAEHWSLQELLTHLVIADLFFTVACLPATKIYSAPELATFLFAKRDELGSESAQLLRHSLPEKQPHELPDLTLVDPWDVD